MIYEAWQAQESAWQPARSSCASAAEFPALPRPLARFAATPELAEAFEMIVRLGISHRRPPFGIDRVGAGDAAEPVTEQVVHRTRFASLLRFAKPSGATQPKVLLVAPMAGHFPTLLRDAVRTMLPEHDVYVTDWYNARDVPGAAGAFGLDEFILHLVEFTGAIGAGAHVIAFAQPCVAALAAVALMAEDADRALPRSLTLVAGPVDARVSPTALATVARTRTRGWYEAHEIGIVPGAFAGAGRRVVPGFLQLARFMSLNLGRHRASLEALRGHVERGELREAGAIRAFYDDYLAVSDLAAEFFLETMERVFRTFDLARGALEVHGRRVDPRFIRSVALLAVEGELDDICGIGQTRAALDLCTGLPPELRRHHLQRGAGHLGVFSGRRWAGEVYPVIRDHVRAAA